MMTPVRSKRPEDGEWVRCLYCEDEVEEDEAVMCMICKEYPMCDPCAEAHVMGHGDEAGADPEDMPL